MAKTKPQRKQNRKKGEEGEKGWGIQKEERERGEGGGGFQGKIHLERSSGNG